MLINILTQHYNNKTKTEQNMSSGDTYFSFSAPVDDVAAAGRVCEFESDNGSSGRRNGTARREDTIFAQAASSRRASASELSLDTQFRHSNVWKAR